MFPTWLCYHGPQIYFKTVVVFFRSPCYFRQSISGCCLPTPAPKTACIIRHRAQYHPQPRARPNQDQGPNQLPTILDEAFPGPSLGVGVRMAGGGRGLYKASSVRDFVLLPSKQRLIFNCGSCHGRRQPVPTWRLRR